MRFEKVSKEQYLQDCKGDILYGGIHKLNDSRDSNLAYDDLKLPQRATKKSAGYDFYAPYTFTLDPGETIKLATGIRALLDDDKFLMCVPRSGLGFKARVQLDNTVGIIDADYSESSNEGHIHCKLTNDSREGKVIVVEKGEAYMQGIILQYFKVDDDNASRQRDGGFGSTTKG